MTKLTLLFKPKHPIPEGYDDPSIEMQNGRLVVTDHGHRTLEPYALRLGIDLSKVDCFIAYLEMRERLAPYFWQRMADQLGGNPQNLEIKILRAIIEGDKKRLHRLKGLHSAMRERSLRVIRDPESE